MRNIRVVHDQVGVYSDWHYSTFQEGIQEPWLTRYWHDYFEGKTKPHYPVPAIADTETVFHLARYSSGELYSLAWDGHWQDDLPEYCEAF